MKLLTLVFKLEDPKLFVDFKYTPKVQSVEDKDVPLVIGKVDALQPSEIPIKYKIVYGNLHKYLKIDEETGNVIMIAKPINCTGNIYFSTTTLT